MPGKFISSSTGWHLMRQHFQGVFASARHNDLVAVSHQRGLHHAADLRIVVHHQDLTRAQLSRPPPLAESEK